MKREYIATLDWVPAALGAKDKRKFLRRWQDTFARQSDLLEEFAFLPDTSIVEQLPPFSFALHFRFKLKKPYLSKDDRDFYLLDNPVRREKVFQTPMVASTTWKGALRSVLWQLDKQDDHPAIIRLFGNPRESEIGKSGRLYFYPTFFESNVDMEVINPHDRESGVGERGPILFESVPPKTTGRFTLLYVPFDRIGNEEADPEKGIKSLPDEATEDLTLVARGLQAMFTLYGFGAKTSSGFGLAEAEVKEGQIELNAPDATPAAQQRPAGVRPAEGFLKYLDNEGEVKPEFRGSGEGGLMSNKEYRVQGGQAGGGSLSEFKEFRSWYVQHGESWKSTLRTQQQTETGSPPMTVRGFDTLGKLVEVAQAIPGDAPAPEGGDNG